MSKKNSKVKRVSGFVMNRRTGHVSFAFKQQKSNVHSLGFTHNKLDRASKRKMRHNIDPSDSSDCYVKTQIEKQKHNDYRRKSEYKDYRIHREDKPLIDSLISGNKKKMTEAIFRKEVLCIRIQH